ncbi:hypothetical protein KBA39_00210 [Myxococcota bacterium]|nr:hypothetical protein [Myxococcota bacterium]
MRRMVPIIALGFLACSEGNPGVQSFDECEQDRDCDDSIACTVDRCMPSVNGFFRCDNRASDELCPDGRICMSESLLGSGCQDPRALACADKTDGETCVVQDSCATSDGFCEGGLCVYARLECPEKPCMSSEGCDARSGICRYSIVSDKTVCDADGDRCTSDSCSGGRCVVGPDTCECSASRPCAQPANPCNGSAECVDGHCVQAPVDCAALNTECLVNYCSPQTGRCEAVAVNEGGACSDSLACTGPGQCQTGVCVASEIDCVPRACNSVHCVEPDGCAYTPIAGTCDDGDLCNGRDACHGGVCQPEGPAIRCDDMNQCTADECIPRTGTCRFVPIPDCCGNHMVESGEDCDGLSMPQEGCLSCQYSTVRLDVDGTSPVVAWSGVTSSGLVTWEVVDGQGGHGVAMKAITSRKTFGETIPVPAGTVSGRDMSPVVVAAGDGFVVGALTTSAPEFWLTDATGRVRIGARVANPWNGSEPTGRMVMARSELRGVAAWSVAQPGGNQQLLYADLAVGPDRLLVSGSAVAVDTFSEGEIVPGDACPVDDGVVVMFTFRDHKNAPDVLHHKAAWFRAQDPVVHIVDLAVSYWDQSYHAVCAPAENGGFLAVYSRLERTPVQRIVVEGVIVGPDEAIGIPFELWEILDDTGPQVMPFSSDLAWLEDGTFMFVCPWLSPSLSAPESVSPAVVRIGASGQVDDVVPLSGPSSNFAGKFAASTVAGSDLSVFWVETSDLSMIYTAGQVGGRLFSWPGL